jgi:hypothetical protein
MHDLACANAIALDLLQGVAENFIRVRETHLRR